MYYLQKYIDYIVNAGGRIPIEQFDEDWEPIGPNVRADLLEKGLAYETSYKYKSEEIFLC